ncbi:hypothetical protein K9M78_07065 [Candidatus Bipolaricaulota bacterium]|nr:hypothetical protein [Candidatus Bipolaricaulota bacterium]
MSRERIRELQVKAINKLEEPEFKEQLVVYRENSDEIRGLLNLEQRSYVNFIYAYARFN